MRGTWKQVADENRSLNRQQHALSEDACRLKDRCGVRLVKAVSSGC